ncbi:hypothetical protein PF006_g23922 [Phytophthora fragariae]|uniref:Uncharacterized protein n=1 Tax=Phytophthora fragariae TaxID=53985 RepID=A0A6A3RF48_9STRA|nr:hypothetical protein PF011_g22896 [Phytophthora fragariae]KAE9095820.1 hypothetical protein PF006_g23922 [Phytophthora fragariae]KAE9294948.1 hypothetical protein PF008_g24407 [Phytophthora fragariae]
MMSGTASAAGGKPKAGLEVKTKGVPVNWNGEHWDFYKALMMSLFEEDDLENIATGKAKPPDPTATDTEKKDWKQNQATIKRLILGSVSLALAQSVMRKVSGTEMWKTLEEMFEARRTRCCSCTNSGSSCISYGAPGRSGTTT